jgi:dihydroorotate dehydrogenase
LAFDSAGWPWEWPLRWTGLIRPNLFTVVSKTLTRRPRRGNLRWYKPWSCVRLIPGGAVNKVGLTNPGIDWWCDAVGPKVCAGKIALVASIHGDARELGEMAGMLNAFDLVGIEINSSCPNIGNAMQDVETAVAEATAARAASRHPVIVKLSVAQDYLEIAGRLRGVAQAISLNSVPWEMVDRDALPSRDSPLMGVGDDLGAGGVSGVPAQKLNWLAVKQLASAQEGLPVIAPSIMQYEDLADVRKLGASAVSFGTIHLRAPWKPTSIVRRDMAARTTGT